MTFVPSDQLFSLLSELEVVVKESTMMIHVVVHGHGVLVYPLNEGVPHLMELPPFPLESIMLKDTFD